MPYVTAHPHPAGRGDAASLTRPITAAFDATTRLAFVQMWLGTVSTPPSIVTHRRLTQLAHRYERNTKHRMKQVSPASVSRALA